VRTEGINTPLPQTEGANRGENPSYPSSNGARLHAQEDPGKLQDSEVNNAREGFTL
jgi:hypothetical protein